MSEAAYYSEPAANDDRFTRPIGLGIPSKRAAAFNAPLQASTAPAPNPYLAAERRLQDSYRSALAAQSSAMRTCQRCGAVMLAGATVCTGCCAPADGADGGAQPDQAAVAQQPDIVEHSPIDAVKEARSSVLAKWPFGPSEATTTSAHDASRTMPGVPQQRADGGSFQPAAPNPFRNAT